mgnify:CR=1 FL=1
MLISIHNRNVFWVPRGSIGPYIGSEFFENDSLEKGWYFYTNFGKDCHGPYKTEQKAIDAFEIYLRSFKDIPEVNFDGRLD